eukprot:TRINITY_DN2848_c0_g1_i8.p1 TRINITY_DN2848_c0_g1~~TRINITY_DN2848_c0_g1_i8.p1  ORF type:complete len:1149 (-),score=251.56 TRINITY_DN2848_c0_g1_i8:291-3737(-)
MILALVGAGGLILAYAEVAFWMMAGERQAIRYREEYFKAILRQDIAWFDTQKTGELTSALSSDIVDIQEAIGEKVGNAIHHFFTFLFGFIVGFIQGWQLALVIISVAPLLALCGGIWTKIFGVLAKQTQLAYAGAGGIAEEVISSVRTVVSFGGEKKEIERYDSKLKETEVIGIRKGLYTGLSMGLTLLIMFSSYALAFWYGAELIIDNVKSPRTGDEMTGGDVLTVFFSVLIGAMAIGQGAPNLTVIVKGRAVAKKAFGIIDRVPPINSSSDEGLKTPIVKGDIQLTNVSFRYPSRPDVKIFDNLNIKVKPGSKVALVGGTGSGKSSVVALLERFYDPEQGSVSVDGVDIKDYNVKWLRQHMGLVSQEPILFVGSIKDNILNGRLDATEDEVITAARIANAHTFISNLPNGYNTAVGERGVQLSGGQKQRIAIARAILKNPPILLLDEATSALDTESEALVQEALEQAMANRTTLIIAHRLSTVRDCDVIIVLNKGVIVESGTHDELIDRQGAYFLLVQRQTSPTDASEVTTPKTRKKLEAAAEDKMEYKIKAATENEQAKEEEAPPVSIGRIYELIKPDLGWAIFGVLNAAVNGCIMPLYSLAFTEMTNTFYHTKNEDIRNGAALWSGVFVAIGVGSFIFETGRGYAFGIVTEKLTRRLRRISFKSILNQDIGYFDMPNHSTGILATKLATDASLVSGNVLRIQLTIQNILSIAAGMAIAFYSGWKLTLVVLSIAPIIIIAGYLQMEFVGGFAKNESKAYESAGEIISQSISGMRTVSSFTLESVMFAEYKRRLVDPLRAGVKKSHFSGLGFGISQAVNLFSYSLSLWYGSVLIDKGELEFDEVMRVTFAIVFTAISSGQISSTLPDLAKTKIATRDIFQVIDTKSAVESMSPDGVRLDRVRGDIELRGVRFAYPSRPDVQIFQDVDITVPAGKTVALVGSSGSGKSSVVSLLERFYLPHSGSITLDGVEISTLNVEWLRYQLGLVSQEPVLFAASIKENIKYGVASATDAEVEEASRIANAYEFISRLPDGFDTFVGERGTQLSGGQKQRIAIARAILKNPPILLLDEATSALDTESEAIVQAALDRAMVNRTTIVIAHRLSTIRHADKIVVLKQGRVVEEGRHDELYALGGFYTQLIERQTGAH